MAGTLKGKVAFVTGASSGIGRAAALVFGREGAKVAVADINQAGGDETVAMITNVGGVATYVQCDVTRSSEVQAAIAATVATYGSLDCAFNNAGILGPQAHVHEMPEEGFERVLKINLFGVFYCLKYELQQMIKQGHGGAIVNTSSVAGLIGSATICPYNSSKHGVIGLTKCAAVDVGRHNIRVNAVCPGFIDTPLTRTEFGNVEETGAHLHKLGRVGLPEEIAEAVVWLCSDAASLVTGIAMPVEGGWTAGVS